MATIQVSNISSSTSEQEIRDFFTYCGKINDVSIKPSSSDENAPLSATITFERKPAADTALLLDNTELHGSNVKVESAASQSDSSSKGSEQQDDPNEIRQEDKPRTAVLAEYLSHGYTIADNMLQKGIQLDSQHGYSDKFKSYLQQLDSKTNATPTARSVDNTYGVTDKVHQGYNVFQRYFEQAMNTPTGQKIRSFYDQGQKNVLDIHNEAMRLKKLRDGKSENCTCGGESGQCTCPEGKCTCTNCAPGGASGSSEKSGLVGVGNGKTKCDCSGNEGVCKCKPGECACEGCSK